MTFQVEGETKEAALEAANNKCDRITGEIKRDAKITVIYSHTGEFQEANKQIVGDNGIIEGPMTEYEANDRIPDLMYEFEDVYFEIKEIEK